MHPLLILILFVLCLIIGAISFRYLYNRATLSTFRKRIEKRDYVKYYDRENLAFKTGEVIGFWNIKKQQFIKVKTIKSIHGGTITRNVAITDIYPLDTK